MFNTNHITPLLAPRTHGQALVIWREAEGVVRARWQAFMKADGESRSRAFAAYVAALDGEEAAAAEVAALTPTRMAA
jgi:hypothetical protein